MLHPLALLLRAFIKKFTNILYTSKEIKRLNKNRIPPQIKKTMKYQD
jgi:hypothetical protein